VINNFLYLTSMGIQLNGKTFNEMEDDSIFAALSLIKFPVLEGDKRQLTLLFTSTGDARIRDKISLILADIADIELVPIIIKKIDEIRNSGHITTLIYACSEYDCAKWIQFFVNLAIDFDDSVYLEAISAIDAISSPISLSDQIICVKELSNYLLRCNKGSKREAIKKLILFIEDLSTV
jgi:hypothetical protein